MDRKIAVVIPCYKVKSQILKVISRIGPEISAIYVIDDKCPESSGKLVSENCGDPRVKIIFHEKNLGVGGAVISGYRAALADQAEIVVKLDGDGQMNPALINELVQPIIEGVADYTKGNRFFSIEMLASMPAMRVFGNSVVSFLSKAATGYWDVMDPANGFTAIHSSALSMLPLEKLSQRYFFESDMLFRLNTLRAVVKEYPMQATYADEESNLKISRVALEFPFLYLNRFLKRIFYNYFLRDFNFCSLELIAGLVLLSGGMAFGLYNWYLSSLTNDPATTGTVMLAALPVILGFQAVLSAASFDVMNLPRNPLQKQFGRKQAPAKKGPLVQFPQDQVINRK